MIFDYLIVGGGFAGLSTAYYLLKEKAGTVCLLEKEAAPGRSASGQNASMINRLADDPLTSLLSTEGADAFVSEFTAHLRGIDFKKTRTLYIGKKRDLRKYAAASISRRAALRKYPFLKNAAFDAAIECADDAVAETRSVARALAAHCRKSDGMKMICSAQARPRRAGRFFEVRVNGKTLRSPVLVNAAGAWAGEVAAGAGGKKIPIFPRRRHLFVTQKISWAKRSWPIVWDVSRNFYFRPEKSGLLVSPCDETQMKPGPAPFNASAEHLARTKLLQIFPEAGGVKFRHGWAGLRTFSKDGLPVIGWDPKVNGLFWAACLDGHGLTTCAFLGKLSARLIQGKPVDTRLAKTLSPARF